jgi:DNA ligase (NAD+)
MSAAKRRGDEGSSAGDRAVAGDHAVLAQVHALRELLSRANVAYYVDAEPIMSDSDYDARLAELARLESDHPELVDPDSPTQRVGGALVGGFAQVRHGVPMLSIDNTYDLDGFRAWYERCAKGLDSEPALVAEPKIDGVAISLRYEGGRLVRAVTRGDGTSGDDVTANVRAIRAVPLKLAHAEDVSDPLEVRGEIYMPNAEFDRINAERERHGEPLFANARNSTAGTLKSLDPGVVAARRLAFSAHGRGECGPMPGGSGPEGHWSFLSLMRSLGIPASPLARLCRGRAEAESAIEEFRALRTALPYGVDGIVLRVDAYADQESLGSTAKSPRWIVAFKYPAERAQTVLRAVDWQVGKGGTLTPRATMDPVLVAGTTVRHATLHNIEEIRRKDIRIGDRVVIEKAGEIIPQVVEPVVSVRTGDEVAIEPPGKCPACGTAVVTEGPKVLCPGASCPAQFRERLKWFVGRDQMDIDGLGERIIDQLVDAGIVRTFADLFALDADAIAALESEAVSASGKLVRRKLGAKTASSIVTAAHEARGRGLARVLAGLGIRHVGASAAKTLARHFRDIDELLAADASAIEALPDFGAKTASSVVADLAAAPMRAAIGALRDAGVDMRSHAERPATEGAFAGKTIVITGTLEGWTRPALTELLESRGAKVAGSVSRKTDILIAGAEAGSKLDKARELGVDVWDESRLRTELG